MWRLGGPGALGRLLDGTLVEGVEVFRRLYTAAGFGVLVAPTRLPGIAQSNGP